MSAWLWDGISATFAGSLAALIIVWLIYPALVAIWARLRPYRSSLAKPRPWPSLSVIIAAHNEADHIVPRIRNLWDQHYRGGIEILVSEDGSSDGTAEQVRMLLARIAAQGAEPACPVRLLCDSGRRGKAAAVNRAAAAARGSILVLTDANNEFAAGALEALATPFGDRSVGAVTGRKAVAAAVGLGGGESFYFQFENWLMRQETATGSTVGGFGEVLAVRRECFVPLPTHAMVNDDLFLVLQVLARKRRVLAAANARSWEHGAADTVAEWERRQRMAVGRWGALASLRQRRDGRCAWRALGWGTGCKVLFHEVLRPISAVWLVLAVLTGTGLLAAPLARVAAPLRQLAWLQAGFWVLVISAGIGRWRGLQLGRWEAPYFFCLAQLGALGGAWRYLRGRQSPQWRRVARARAAGPHALPGVNNGHILHGLFWASSSFLLGKLLVFGSIVILARLLVARAFGEVTLATSAVMVLEILGTLGLTSAVIFEERAVASAANICFWTTLVTAVIETALGWEFAPWVARFFHEPALAPMLRVLCLSLVVTALGNTHDTLLRRKLAFRAKLVPDLAQAAAKGGAAIALALAGFGAWSLIWGQVLGTIVATTLLWQVMDFRPGRHWDREVARRMFGYAKHIYLLDGSSVLLSNLDALTIGRMLNAVWLGFYTLAFRIPEVMLISVLNVITRVIFPAFSRLQDDRAALRTTLLDTSRYTALLTLPLAAGMGLLAPELVRSVYGWHWERSIPVLEVLALYGGIRCISHHFGDAYKAMGRPDILSRTTLAWWLLLPPSLILGAHWDGVVGVAWGEVFTRAAMTVLHVYLVTHYIEIRAVELWKCFAPALEATVVMGMAVVAAHPFTAGWPPRPALTMLVLVGGSVYVLFLRWRHPLIVRAVLDRLRRLGDTVRTGPPVTVAAALATPLVEASEERAA